MKIFKSAAIAVFYNINNKKGEIESNKKRCVKKRVNLNYSLSRINVSRFRFSIIPVQSFDHEELDRLFSNDLLFAIRITRFQSQRSTRSSTTSGSSAFTIVKINTIHHKVSGILILI